MGSNALVADEELVDILARVFVNLLEPALHVVERFPVGDVVNDDDAVGAPVVRAANRAEALLPRRIPYLQLNALAVKLYCPDLLLRKGEGGGDTPLAESGREE